MLPLEGLTVISLEQAVAAPFATRQLADLGARVIKVERPGKGDFARDYDNKVNGMSSHFTWLNRTKESICLDLKSEEGKEILERLLNKADIFVHNLAPGAIERLGYDKDNIKRKFPNIINCRISGYGDYGPYTYKKAYDLLIQCEAGLVSITGTEESPAKSGISIADIAAGMYAYSGILTALIKRNINGEGEYIEISMLEALAEWMGYPIYYSMYSKDQPKRTGTDHATIYPYGSFSLKDGKSIFIAIQNEREWMNFCESVIKEPDLAQNRLFNSNSNRVENRSELAEILINKFKKISSKEIVKILDEEKIANAILNNIDDLINHPQLEARNRWRKLNSPVGKINILIPPITFSSITNKFAPIPSVGEHTQDILNELNYKKE